MNKKDEFNYYDAYTRQINYAKEMILNLRGAVNAGELGTHELMDALHTVENDADQVNHDIHAHLMSDFVVPMERTGMGALANALDDVSDAIEDLAIRAYYYHCDHIEPDGGSIMVMMAEAIEKLAEAVGMLDSKTRRRQEAHECLIKVQTLESECDHVYIDSVYKLYGNAEMDGEQRRIAHAMLSSLEDAMDAIEHAADSVETIITENA